MGPSLLPLHRSRRLGRTPILAARGVSLIELLVVLFIMGIMMGMLLPALNGVRNQAQAKVCENNIRQLGMALQRAIEAKKRFPAPGQWTFDVLPYTEQVQLHFLLKQNREVDPKFPRPPLLRCPMQEPVPSRVESVGPCHYAVVVDRFPNGEMNRGWEMQDLPLMSDDSIPEPWYAAPEISYAQRAFYFDEKPGPHPPGMYMTDRGLQPNAH